MVMVTLVILKKPALWRRALLYGQRLARFGHQIWCAPKRSIQRYSMQLEFIKKMRIPTLLATFLILAALPLAAQVSPTVIYIDPQPETLVLDLVFINVNFDVAVVGVDASDLLINGIPATDVVAHDNDDYTFQFPQPPAGPVQVA